MVDTEGIFLIQLAGLLDRHSAKRPCRPVRPARPTPRRTGGLLAQRLASTGTADLAQLFGRCPGPLDPQGQR